MGREHVVRADRTGPIVRRTRRVGFVLAALAVGSVLLDVLAVRWLEPGAWWMRTPFLFLLAPTFGWYALVVARFLPRMRGDYVVRREDDRVVASWRGVRTAEVMLADPISLRPIWPSGRGFVLATPRAKVMLHPELEGLGELVADLRALGIGDQGIPLSDRHAFVGADERREPVPEGVTADGLARLARIELVAGSAGVLGMVAWVIAALTGGSLALVAAGTIAGLVGGGVAMAARGRFIAEHGVYRFLGGTVLVREATHARRVGAVLVACGALIAALGVLAALAIALAIPHWLATR